MKYALLLYERGIFELTKKIIPPADNLAYSVCFETSLIHEASLALSGGREWKFVKV